MYRPCMNCGVKMSECDIECSFKEKMEELKSYRDAEEQGLLIRLPCKVGDTVYEANMERNLVSEYGIQEIIINKYGVSFFRWTLKDGIYSHLTGCPIECFGKTVFFTRKEAEEALRKGAEHDG